MLNVKSRKHLQLRIWRLRGKKTSENEKKTNSLDFDIKQNLVSAHVLPAVNFDATDARRLQKEIEYIPKQREILRGDRLFKTT